MKKRSALIILAVAGGCNLGIDTDDYPYQQLIIIEDTGTGEDVAVDVVEDVVEDLDVAVDVEEDVEVDEGPTGAPSLVITEVMVNTSEMSGVGAGEIGEFIEVKNVGTAAADPRRISFQIVSDTAMAQTISVPQPTTEEQVAIQGALQAIEPGEYFVYVRYPAVGLPLEAVLEAGTYYDFGQGGVTVSLANSGERILSVQYFDGKSIRTHDSVRWSSNALRPSDPEVQEPSLTILEDVSLSVGRGFESSEANDTPANWCVEITEVAGPGTFFATPGSGATCAP